jgi:hypothetical protein
MKLALVIALALVPSLASADTPAPPAIKLVAPGKAPTKALRLEWKKGVKATVEVATEEWLQRNASGDMSKPDPKPTIRTTIDVEVAEVRAKGDVRIDVVYRKIEADKAIKADVATRMNSLLGPLAGAKGHNVVSARGVVIASELKPPAGANPQLAQQLEALRSLSGQVATAYPEEAVGVGAKWETGSTIRTPEPTGGDLVIQQTTTYELLELAGTKGKIAIALTGLGKSKDGKLTISTKSKGEIAFDLATPVGGSGRIETLTEIKLDAGGKVPMTQVNTSITTITTRAR